MMTWQDKHKFEALEAEEIKRAEEEEIRMAALKASMDAGGGGNLEDLEEEESDVNVGSIGVVSQM